MPTVLMCCNRDHLDVAPYNYLTEHPSHHDTRLCILQPDDAANRGVASLNLKLGTSFDTAFLRSVHGLHEVACCPGT